jgi:uncharacterized damage-inducible protein DinB
MNPEQAKMFLNFFVSGLESEIATTRKVIQNVPEGKKSYKPDAKSMSANDLAWHIASTEVWFLGGILKGKFEMDPTQENPSPATIKEILDYYEKNMGPLLTQVKSMSGEDLAKVVPFFGMQMPNVSFLNILINHSIHHRGQLSAYLRPMGAKVPSIYGGSADEPFQMESAGA